MKERIIKFLFDEKTQIIVKLFVVILLISSILDIAKFSVNEVDEIIEDKDLADVVEICDSYYYEREFAKLRETLILNAAFEDIFDKYWEAVNGYCDYMQYNQWKLTPSEEVITSEYKQTVIDNYENLKFEDNKKILKEYCDAVK